MVLVGPEEFRLIPQKWLHKEGGGAVVLARNGLIRKAADDGGGVARSTIELCWKAEDVTGKAGDNSIRGALPVG
jgi:hypothetical protein